RRHIALQRRQVEVRHAQLFGDVLHRRLAGRYATGDDEDVVTAALLAGRELEHRERRAAHVEARDRMDDVHPGHVPTARQTPTTSQNVAVSGVPPKSASPAIAPTAAASHAAASGTRTARVAAPASRTRKAAEPTRPSSAATSSNVCCGMSGRFAGGK